jgi:SAM-dependent methyltransferase
MAGIESAHEPTTHDPYEIFYAEVAARQLTAWLPEQPTTVLDLSGGCGTFARLMVEAGHDVVRTVVSGKPEDVTRLHHLPNHGQGRVLEVAADSRDLRWLAPESLDIVLAESRSLSFSLLAEDTVEEIGRALRPGGRLLLCVDSLVLGLARLAEQGRWAELADVPSADVVLVPSEDGTITRCFWPEELRALLIDAGLHVDWVRPRTVLSREAVVRALATDSSTLATLVRTEVALAADREGESVGIHLLASASRPMVG